VTVLSGTVKRPTGEPASTATVELHNSSGDVLDQVICDVQGRFRYHLVPGQWSLFVWDPAGGRAEVEVQLKEDAAVSIDLERV
jgi:hypothetical protein